MSSEELDFLAAEATWQDTEIRTEDGPFMAEVRHYMDIFDLTEAAARKKIEELHGLISKDGEKRVPENRLAAAYLVRLDQHIPNAQVIQSIANLPESPELMTGTDENGGKAEFCRVDHRTRTVIAAHFAGQQCGHPPTFLQITRASKALSYCSLAPSLGKEMTLPQFRADSPSYEPRPRQGEYPVWYFFYGMLANAGELALILQLPEQQRQPEYRPAIVHGAQLLSERALVDAAPTSGAAASEVHGQAFLVGNEWQEEALCFSVTDKFEVVRCRMTMRDSGGMVDGLTFRYIGADL